MWLLLFSVKEIHKKLKESSLIGKTVTVDDENAWEIDEWECLDDEEDKLRPDPTPSSQPPRQQSSRTQLKIDSSHMVAAPSLSPPPMKAASDLIKTLGGGLASMVEGFNLTNLSTTLSAFDSASGSSGVATATRKAAATEEAHGWGWNNWGSFAKSISSTVENTVGVLHM